MGELPPRHSASFADICAELGCGPSRVCCALRRQGGWLMVVGWVQPGVLQLYGRSARAVPGCHPARLAVGCAATQEMLHSCSRYCRVFMYKGGHQQNLTDTITGLGTRTRSQCDQHVWLPADRRCGDRPSLDTDRFHSGRVKLYIQATASRTVCTRTSSARRQANASGTVTCTQFPRLHLGPAAGNCQCADTHGVGACADG